MATFAFSLVSPERELFGGPADAVLVPGTEGLFEVQAGHAPVMSTLNPGLITIRQGGTERKFYVRGGFADATPDGLTVLAEIAIPEAELTGAVLAAERAAAAALGANSDAEDQMAAATAQRVLAAY